MHLLSFLFLQLGGRVVSVQTVNTPTQASSCRKQVQYPDFFCTNLQGMSGFPPLFRSVSSPRCLGRGDQFFFFFLSRQPKQRLPLLNVPVKFFLPSSAHVSCRPLRLITLTSLFLFKGRRPEPANGRQNKKCAPPPCRNTTGKR